VTTNTIMMTEANVNGNATLTKGMTRRLMTKLATPPTTNSTAATSTMPVLNCEVFPIVLLTYGVTALTTM